MEEQSTWQTTTPEGASDKRHSNSMVGKMRATARTHPDAAHLPAGLTAEQTLAWFCEPRDEVSETEKRLFPDSKRDEKKTR